MFSLVIITPPPTHTHTHTHARTPHAYTHTHMHTHKLERDDGSVLSCSGVMMAMMSSFCSQMGAPDSYITFMRLERTLTACLCECVCVCVCECVCVGAGSLVCQ